MSRFSAKGILVSHPALKTSRDGLAVIARLDPGWQVLAGHLAFLIVLAVRPEGLFPKVRG